MPAITFQSLLATSNGTAGPVTTPNQNCTPVRLGRLPRGRERNSGLGGIRAHGLCSRGRTVGGALTRRRPTPSCKRLAGVFLRPGSGLDNLFESLYRLYVLGGRMKGRPRCADGDCVHTQFLPLHQRRLPLLRRTR
jgi:hypothetical protein